jgi:hypothetical protein
MNTIFILIRVIYTDDYGYPVSLDNASQEQRRIVSVHATRPSEKEGHVIEEHKVLQ